MTTSLTVQINGEEAMVAWGRRLGEALADGGTVFFHGDLGTGKTTLCRGVIHAFGHEGPVKSPTYTLVEPYRYRGVDIYHFDLYRLGDPEELEYIGFRDYFDGSSVCLVEWPEKGAGMLPTADLDIFVKYMDGGRQLRILSSGQRGGIILKKISETCIEVS